jgi:hypothetical protein
MKVGFPACPAFMRARAGSLLAPTHRVVSAADRVSLNRARVEVAAPSLPKEPFFHG